MRSLTQPWRIVNRNQRRSSRQRTRSLEREPKAIEVVDLDTPVEYALNVKLRIVVAGARGLPLKEKTSGASVDTFAVLSCGGSIQQTQVVKNSISPEWNTTFEIPLTKISPRRLASGLLVTVYDKDRFKSSFIGRLHLHLNEFFSGTNVPIAFHDPRNEPKWYPLKDRNVRRTRYLRRRKSVQSDEVNGEIGIKYGLVDAHGWQGTRSRQEWQEFWMSLLQQQQQTNNKPKAVAARRIERRFSTRLSTSAPEAKIIIPASGPPLPKTALSYSEHGTPGGGSPVLGTDRKKKKLRRRRRRGNSVVKFYAPDVMGVMFVEVSNAKDLPPERNVIRTGFDMDPFVVLSFGRHTFRTRAIRHNLNPVWNEKLFFHVRHSELKYNLKFAIYDKDKFSGNDFVAWQEMPVVDIISKSMSHAIEVTTNEQDPQDLIEKEMDTHTIDLKMANRAKWEGKHTPRLSFRAKFLPYTTIRKMFFMALAKPYDLEGNGMMNRLGVQAMLESLGSNITEATVNGFWERWKKSPETEDLTTEELIECLEEHLLRDHKLSRQRSRTTLVNDDYFSRRPIRDDRAESPFTDRPGTSEDSSPVFSSDGGVFSDGPVFSDGDMFPGLNYFEELSTNLTGPLFNYDRFIDSLQDSELSGEDEVDMEDSEDDEIDDEPLADANGVQLGEYSPSGPLTGSDDSQSLKSASRDSIEEKVIRVSECPVCHRPNLARKRQMDIITHIATCAANDWTTVDRFLMGNFVTEAYAQRKWFVKLVSKVGYGRYSLGTNNANIIVQDRRSGQLIEERMSVYVRLGMRLLYKGMKTSVQSKRAQRILLNMTMRQGRRFDSTKSAREIPSFITFHKLDMSEVRDPLHSFKTFNQFFYRKLRVGARPCTNPNDPKTLVSPADCRMLAFPTINDATRVWIKGINFSVGKLLGDPDMGKQYEGGALTVFRLAPQDYHRFHSPVDGVISEAKYISGQFYTVNPMAIRTTLDVFGENARSVVFIDSPEFGRVAMVCIGAMMVGSIVITATPGSTVKRTDEVGYFAFGGSTLVCICPPNTTQFDQDLVDNSATALESLVRVGDQIGKKKQPASGQSYSK
ncbi:phosphatidylserine decarboxylase-domain-containing protein [Umbelopsis sp. AD052]|nr:phosphatidylserine decarboxylase-domain-containing protein [Umbelopsis sp. AD052]